MNKNKALLFLCWSAGSAAMSKPVDMKQNKKHPVIVNSSGDVQEVRIEVITDVLKKTLEKRKSLPRESGDPKKITTSPVLLPENKNISSVLLPRIFVQGGQIRDVVSEENVTSRGVTPRDDKGNGPQNNMCNFNEEHKNFSLNASQQTLKMIREFAEDLEKKEDGRKTQVLDFLAQQANKQPSPRWLPLLCVGVATVALMQITVIGMMIALLARAK